MLRAGYVPKWLYKFGLTYKNACDRAVDDHISAYKRKLLHDKRLHDTLVSFPRMQPLNFDPEVMNHLNTYRDPQDKPPCLAGKIPVS